LSHRAELKLRRYCPFVASGGAEAPPLLRPALVRGCADPAAALACRYWTGGV